MSITIELATEHVLQINNGQPSTIVVQSAGVPGPGGSGSFDGVHNDLTGRTADDAHPISAITGLQDALDAAGGGIPLSSIGLLDGERNRGYWDAGVVDYVVGDVVFDGIYFWLAVTPATGVSPVDPAWTDISARDGLTVELGAGASASGVNSSAIGLTASASGDYSSAVGGAALASGDYSSAIGGGAQASGFFSSAVGPGASASGNYTSAIGAGASASGDGSSAIGADASASGDGDVNLAHIVTGHVDWTSGPAPDGLVLETGFADLPVTADATDPSTDRKRLIARTDGLYVRDETGTEVGPLGAGGGGGDVVGPASATDGAVALFDGTTGKLLKNGSVLGTAATVDTGTGSGNAILGNDSRLTDARTPTSHNHAASEITSGTIAQARLGTGSGGAGTKVLYDDQTYKTPSSGISDPGGSNDDFLQRKSGAWANRTVAQVKTDLGLGDAAFVVATPVGEYVGVPSPNVSDCSSSSMILSAAGRSNAHPLYLTAATYNKIGVIVNTAGTATLRLGLYASSSTTGLPTGSPVLDAGTISVASTGLQEITISSTLSGGWYWAVVQTDAYTSSFYLQGMSDTIASFIPGIPCNSSTPGRQYLGWAINATSSPSALPSTFTGNQWTTQAPKVILRRSA